MSDSARPVALSEGERAKLSTIDRAVAVGDAAVPTLVTMITEPSWVVRRAVVRGLAALGDAAVPALLEALRSRRDDETRVAAVVEALASSTADLEAALMALAHDGNPAVACDAVQVLGRRRATKAVALLQSLVEEADDNVAVAAIEALGRIGGSAAVDSLVAAVSSHSFFRVFPAIDVLGRTGDPRAVEPLSKLLGEPLYAMEAARALARTGQSSAVAPLARLLLQKADGPTRTAAAALAELHDRAEARHGSALSVTRALQSLPNGGSIARRLSHCLRDATPAERASICTVLGSLGGQESIAVLMDLVELPPPVGPTAERALARLAAEAQAELVRALRDGGSAQRLAALPLVTRLRDVAAVELCLEDPDPAVRVEACAALGRFGDSARVAPLFERIEDPDASVVQAAVSAIQSLGGTETEKRAVELARSPKAVPRRSALRILAYFGYPSALDSMIAAMRDPDQRMRDAGIHGLSFIEDDRATDALLRASEDPAERTRAAAVKALGHRSSAAAIVAALARGLADGDPWVRYYACQSLGKLAVRAMAPDIERLLGDPAGQVRVAAIEALALLGGDAPRRALLDTANRSDDEDMRRAALVGLGMMRDPEALQVLLSAAAAADPMTRLIAVSALASFEAPEIVPALAKASDDAEDTVRTAALGCLASRPDAEATTALIRLLEASTEPERVVLALASPVKGRISGVVSALYAADEHLANRLVSVLGRVGTPDAVTALIEMMATHPTVVRKAAAATLAALGTNEAVETLHRAAQDDADTDIRHIAALLERS